MDSKSRFDADRLERLAAINGTGRFEMEFTDRDGVRHVVSLPVSAAVALGRLICDVSEKMPFLLGVGMAQSELGRHVSPAASHGKGN
jgi:hypothetical protein